MIDVLVTSAFEPELQGLGLPLARICTVGSRRVLACTLGVGPLAAAATAASLLAREPAALVLFVGTAGVFPASRDRFRVGGIAAASSTALVDVAVLRHQAERPTLQTSTFALQPIFADARPHADPLRASVATTTAITVDDDLARELGASGFDLESLELAGVAAASLGAGVPCASVLGISNVVGSEGRAEWRANHVAAARAACDRVAAWLVGNP